MDSTVSSNPIQSILSTILNVSSDSCWAQIAERVAHPCLDNKDVIITAAKCQYHLGNTSKAEEYLNQLCTAKPFLKFDRNDLLGSISTIRSTILRINYLPFVRRNGIGSSVFD